MIGKPEWFMRRKYAGWGIMPKTWQGWVYLAAVVAPMFIISAVTVNETTLILIGAWAMLVLLDTMDIMVRMKKDERDTLHEAIAERNALWVIIFVLAGGVAYQTAQSAVLGRSVWVDPVILIAIVGGLIAKAATNIYLDKHD